MRYLLCDVLCEDDVCDVLCEDDDRSSVSVQKVASVMFENEIVLPHMSGVVSLGARGFTSERHYTKLITEATHTDYSCGALIISWEVHFLFCFSRRWR